MPSRPRCRGGALERAHALRAAERDGRALSGAAGRHLPAAGPGPRDKAVTLTWAAFRAEVTRAANLFRRLGIGPADTVAYLLPNGIEAAVALLAGATAGIVSPVNPLLAPEHIAGILRETGAKVVVTLASFPKTDLAQKVAEAVALAPNVETVLEVDLARYLAPPLSVDRAAHPAEAPAARTGARPRLRRARWRPRTGRGSTSPRRGDDRVCACFHTGGTTGLPKVAQHRASGILYNGWCGKYYIFTEADVLMCPLPLFHVFAAYPILMSCLMTGGADGDADAAGISRRGRDGQFLEAGRAAQGDAS